MNLLDGIAKRWFGNSTRLVDNRLQEPQSIVIYVNIIYSFVHKI